MRVYYLKDIETGLFYRSAGWKGRIVWTKKPRLFTSIGHLKNSLRANVVGITQLTPWYSAFIELHGRNPVHEECFMYRHTRGKGNLIKALPERYQVIEQEIEQ